VVIAVRAAARIGEVVAIIMHFIPWSAPGRTQVGGQYEYHQRGESASRCGLQWRLGYSG
jgi:hypothetical protein